MFHYGCFGVAGTFTLSNLGMFGVDRFDAILPPGTVSKRIEIRILWSLVCCFPEAFTGI